MAWVFNYYECCSKMEEYCIFSIVQQRVFKLWRPVTTLKRERIKSKSLPYKFATLVAFRECL